MDTSKEQLPISLSAEEPKVHSPLHRDTEEVDKHVAHPVVSDACASVPQSTNNPEEVDTNIESQALTESTKEQLPTSPSTEKPVDQSPLPPSEQGSTPVTLPTKNGADRSAYKLKSTFFTESTAKESKSSKDSEDWVTIRRGRSTSQPASRNQRLSRSRSNIRVPFEDPSDSVRMTQIFLEDEPWHSCYLKGCRETFSSFQGLKEHVSREHPKLKPRNYPYPRKSCKTVTNNPKEWILHIANEHPDFVIKGIRQSSRLDRIYLSKDFTCRSAECSLFPYSDHNCVHVGFKELRSYYKLWSTLKPSFKSMTEWWENIKGRIKHLAIQHSVRIARQKKKRLLLLQRVCCNSNEDEVDNIIESELRGACIRSRVKILEENEKPSAFFYREERRRAERKVIKSIKNDDGRIVSSNSEITDVFHNFYTNLFTRHADVNLNLQDAFIQCLNHKISDDDKRILDEPISLVELNKAVSRAASNKSPGSDGLPYEFYSSFIDILGNDLVDVFNDTFHSGTLSESQRMGIITLIPKKGDTTNASNWRPISLLNTDYKLIAKILQTRLARVLPSIVNEYQTCAIPGRSIHNNMLIVRDVVDFCTMKDLPCALISIDQEKAFDKVNWSFLMKVLRKFNFGKNFQRWFSILYNNIYSCLLINGNLSEPVYMKRGVRQGCPLSPLLYILFVEPLASFINSCVSIKGFAVPGSRKSIKFLQYADDATCIATCISDIPPFFSILKDFGSATGTCINMMKTCGLKLGRFCSLQLPGNIQWSTKEIKITGIVFGTNDAVLSNWGKKIESSRSRIKSWTNRHLSLLGKTMVINTVIYPLFYFLGPIFPMPYSVLKEIHKIVFSLVWGSRKPDLVSRDVIVLPQLCGGLGLDNLRVKMNALLVKPLFPLFRGNDIPTHLITSRYFIAKQLRVFYPGIWSNSRPNSNMCTSSLSQACDVLKQLFMVDNNFAISCKHTKNIVKLLQPVNVTISIVRKNPTFPWEKIWKLAFSSLLDNKLKDFQWRLAHQVLYTGKRIKDWGMGDGICPFEGCGAVETLYHIFWDCPKVKPVLTWTAKVFREVACTNQCLHPDLLMFGFPDLVCTPPVFQRIWFIFCVVKFTLWKSRCLQKFESEIQDDKQLKSIIIKSIKDRVEADRSRFSNAKFKKMWITGRSFVRLRDDHLLFTL
ncbi:hypothetical protein HOLleu_21924 [Holothuria leucospilota]|uniref:Reverse transcriptase domain-containing protein n=1 Tax=Holothuria leucospilota TaxID=206669 RepID=A0A9Q1H4B6_HOLLE|nr:hypothetical protein HOLleu_21924 [Holothuria leucospilota]